MNRLRTILLLAGVLLAAAAIAGVAQPRLGRSATPTAGTLITVTGNGTVDATPDRASFDFGVASRGVTAAEAADPVRLDAVPARYGAELSSLGREDVRAAGCSTVRGSRRFRL